MRVVYLWRTSRIPALVLASTIYFPPVSTSFLVMARERCTLPFDRYLRNILDQIKFTMFRNADLSYQNKSICGKHFNYRCYRFPDVSLFVKAFIHQIFIIPIFCTFHRGVISINTYLYESISLVESFTKAPCHSEY